MLPATQLPNWFSVSQILSIPQIIPFLLKLAFYCLPTKPPPLLTQLGSFTTYWILPPESHSLPKEGEQLETVNSGFQEEAVNIQTGMNPGRFNNGPFTQMVLGGAGVPTWQVWVWADCKKTTKDSVVPGMCLGVTLSRLKTIRGVNRWQNLKKGYLESAASLWLFLRWNKYSDHTLLLPFFQSLAKRSWLAPKGKGTYWYDP